MGRVIRVDYADPSKKASSGGPVDSMRMVIDKAERKVTYSSSASAVPILREKPPMRRVASTNVGHIDDDDDVVVVDNDGDDDDDDDDDPLEQLLESTTAIANSSGGGSSRSVKVKIYNDRKETSRIDDRSKSWSADAQWNIRNKQQRYDGRSSTSKYGDRGGDIGGGDRGGDRSKASSSPVRPRTRPTISSSSSYSSSTSSSSVNRSPSSRSSSSSSPPQHEATLYFGNLAYAVTEAVLKAEIERFTGDSSSVAAVRIATDLETGRKKGFGYVDVFKKEVAAKVIIVMEIMMMVVMIMMMMMDDDV
jgi:hypothetical protein